VILRSALLYFAIVFGAGFLLAPVRLLVLVPRYGIRAAELLEMPVMLAVMIFASRWVGKRGFATTMGRLSIGLLALVMLLTTECALAFVLRGMTPLEYFISRDPISGTVYFALLGVFAILPMLRR